MNAWEHPVVPVPKCDTCFTILTAYRKLCETIVLTIINKIYYWYTLHKTLVRGSLRVLLNIVKLKAQRFLNSSYSDNFTRTFHHQKPHTISV